MTIYSDLSRVRYVGNGVTTQFAVPFKFFSNKDGSSQLSVYIGDSDIPLEENKDYKINGAGQEEGGEVIFLETPQAGMQIAIIRNVPQTQETVLKNEDKFPAAVYENALDKLTMEVQEIKENLGRAIVLPPTSDEKPLEARNEILEAREEAANSASAALASAEQAQEAAANATQAIQTVETMLEEAEADISQTVSQAQTTIQGYVDNAEEEVVQIATSTAQAAVADAAEEATQIALTNLQPLVDSASSSASTASTAATNAAQSASEAANSATAAEQSETNAANSANLALEAATKASFGNIGDIKYTIRTDVPNGGAWCDGSEYTKAAFPDIYQMLVDGKISYTDYTSFSESISENGSCGFFALDEDNEKFKVPLLKDVYLKAGDVPNMFGSESLPNITGSLSPIMGRLETTPVGSGFVYANNAGAETLGAGAFNLNIGSVNFNASRNSSTYQEGAKVNPDHVVYRAYVVLYSSAAEASETQAQEFINALANKVSKTGNETISGVKTFIENIITNGVIPTTDRSNKAATTQWIYDNVACKVGTYSYQFAGSSTQDVILKIGYGQATSSGQQNYFSSSFPNSCHGVLITMTYGLESSIKNDLWYTDLTASGFVAHKVDTVNFFYIAIGY